MMAFDKPIGECFHCKEQGDWVKDCPNKTPASPHNSYDKAMSRCFGCDKPGHWIKECPKKTFTNSDSEPSRFSDCDIPVLYCPCGAGPCTVRTSKTSKNPNRMFYACPVPQSEKKDCNFFQWCDEVKNSPQCPCGAGACSIHIDGEFNGRQFYACRIKKGHGACNFLQPVDPKDYIVVKSHSAKRNLSSTASVTSTGPRVYTGIASDLCNGGPALAIHQTMVPAVRNCQDKSDHLSVTEGSKCDGISGILTPTKGIKQSEIEDPENADSSSDYVAGHHTAETESSELQMPKVLCYVQQTPKAEIHPQQTELLRQNSDVRSSSTEVHSYMPSPSSSRVRYPSIDSCRCSHAQESQASKTPEYPQQPLYECTNCRCPNCGHYVWGDEIPYSMMMHIDELKQENGELKNEIKNLKKQVAEYLEKEKEKVPKFQVKRILAAGTKRVIQLVYKSCFVIAKAIFLSCFVIAIAMFLSYYISS